jgi:CHAT domain-containing protein
MADLLASRPLDLPSQERSLYGEAVKLKSQISALQSELPALVGQTDPQARQRAAELSTRIDQLESQYQSVMARMAKDAPRLNELLVSQPVSLARLQQSMRRENYEVLQYLVVEHGVILWHISADAMHAVHVFLPRPQVMEKVAQLRKSLDDHNAPFAEQTARELFLFLVQPTKPWLKSDHLVIIPHEDLHQVPFQALQDPADGRFLGEHHALSYAPSATVLLGLKKATGIAGGTLLAIADPDIEAARDEVEAIAKLYPGRAKVVKEPLVKETEVKAWVGGYDIVHLSVHGKFNVTEPLLSSIQLGVGDQDDGQLTAAEMFGLPLDRARLVVLSACETGKAEVTHGNEVLGMMRALIYAGAGSLVLSYWPVESEATALWMESFYLAAQSAPPAEAARQALQAVKSRPEYKHPYFWAAFMTVGR